ncbi:MAG TPA: PDR/VanB family oxidoreductase [Amycolatopsis sp.]|nr:PDR/VanB family oxidoreductase [Amycolatopsis sp.]
MSTLVGVGAVYRRLARYSGKRRPHVEAVDRTIPVVVERVTPEAEAVVSLRLAADRPLPAWRPGAHVDLVLPSGLVRQYSLCGDPADPSHYRVAVRRVGEASAQVHALRPGSSLAAKGPRNAFPFVAAKSYLFVAGGIGITPILPMVRAAAARGAEWRLVYTGRSRASMPFLEELADLPEDRVWVRPDDDYGIPASGAELLDGVREGASVYCCGPAPMITGVRVDLALTGAGGVYFERFSTPPIVGGEPYEVVLRRSGRTLAVPADRSTLDVVREVLPDVPFSCRQGFCCTCAVATPDGGSVRLCVDRGPAVLEL